MDIKSIQTTFSKIVEAAGENGITDEQAAKEIVKKHRVSNFEAMEALQEINKNLGAGIALEYDKGVFFYRKSKQPTQKKEPGRTFTAYRAMQTGIDRSRRKPRRVFQAHRATEGSSLLLP